MFSAFVTELRVAIRRLARSPLFVLATVVVLGLGLGANVILFNTAYALLWRPLDFPRPDRLTTIYSQNSKGRTASGAGISGHQAALLSDQARSFAEVGLVSDAPTLSLFNGNDALDLAAANVNSAYLRALGLRPLGGRLFGGEEDFGAVEERALLLETAWRRYFGEDWSVVGRSFWFQAGAERQQVRIVGIVKGNTTLPFAQGAEVLLAIPWRSEGVVKNDGDAIYRSVLRLKPGVTINQASTEAQTVLGDNLTGAAKQRYRYGAQSLQSAVMPSNGRPMFLLCGAAGLLLILMCANLASLLLARAIGRLDESSMRLALGARRRNLLLNNVLESVLLCLAGTAVAFDMAAFSRPWVLKFVPELKRVGPERLAVGPALLVFGLLLCAAVAFFIALPGSVHAVRVGTAGVLSRAAGRSVAGTNRWIAVLLSAQLAIILTLLTVTGAVERSFVNAIRTDPGFNSRNAVTFRVSLPVPRAALAGAAWDLTKSIASLRGVSNATFAAEPPLGGGMATVMRGQDGGFETTDPFIAFRMIGSQYFETLGARLVAGRGFSDAEVQRGEPLIVLNESAARLLFGDASPLGRSVHTGFLGLRNEVVGIVRDIRHGALDADPLPSAYLPYRPIFPGSLNFIARTDNAVGFASVLNQGVRNWNSGALVRDYQSLEEITRATVQNRLLSGVLIAGFAILGLLVGLVGLYGNLATQVQKRSREFGLRMALGASPRSIVRTVLRSGLRLVAAGLVAGTVASIAAVYAIRHLLYGVGAVDAVSMLAAVAILCVVAVCACLMPALRATQVDPAQSLRAE